MSYYPTPQSGLTELVFGKPGPDFYIGKTIELKVEAGQIAAEWPAATVAYPVDAAIQITRTVSDALSQMNGQIGKLTERDPAMTVLYTLSQIEMQSYSKKLGSCISDAKNAGAAVAVCPNLRSATITALNNIVGHYETIAKKAFELDSDIILNIKESFTSVKEIMRAIGKGVTQGFDKFVTRPIGLLADLVKWGSIGGGLFLLYWYVLRPTDKK